MEYYLDIDCYGTHEKINLTSEEFNLLKSSKSVLDSAFKFEEKYDLLISNYVDLEKDIFGLTLENIVSWDCSFFMFYQRRAIINRRFLAVLTMARLYIDSIASDAKKCVGRRDVSADIREFLSAQYDSNIEYRFIEALRNTVQHHNLPIHSWSNGIKHIDNEEASITEYHSSFYARKKELLKDNRFNKRVLNELPESIDLLKSMRIYITCLSDVHIQTRELMVDEIACARETIEKYINKFKSLNNADSDNNCNLEIGRAS
ncbi:hypothetical protein JCM30760_04260 [Thiomicrorhabdus hydrogeniphila]